MAVRQYIGARYVPKFFENPDGSNEWLTGIPYESLTVVTYAGIQFISKKPVPSSVGTPNANTEYWLVTGSSSGGGSIPQEILEQINKNTNDIKSVSNSVENIENNLSLEKRIIFISDSYGEPDNSWIEKCVSKLKLANGNYYKSALGGSGFKPSSNNTLFLTLLQNLKESVVSPDTITHIVVGGGFNDRQASTNDLLTNIKNFCNYCNTNYPNARILIGGFGWSFNGEFVNQLLNGQYLEGYKNCSLYGAEYITGSDYIMHNFNNYKQESEGSYELFLGYQYVHPNDEGHNLIAACVCNYLNGKSFHYYAKLTKIPIYPATGVNFIGTVDVNETLDDDIITAVLHANIDANWNTPQNDNPTNYIEIGSIKNGFIAGASSGNTKPMGGACVGYCSGGGIGEGVILPVNMMVAIANNRVYAQFTTGGKTFTKVYILNCRIIMQNIYA